MADPQVHNPPHVTYYERRFIDELSTRDDFAFGVVLGDIVRNDLSLFTPYLPVNARLPGQSSMSWATTTSTMTPPLTTAVATFTRVFRPANYALMEGHSVFISSSTTFSPRYPAP